MNSKITFDEYFELFKVDFLYQCGHNPSIIYEYGIHPDKFDPNNPDDKLRKPEVVANSEIFR